MNKAQRFKRLAITFTGAVALVGASLVGVSGLTPQANASESNYLIGTGISDVTGAIAENGAFGYASHQEMKGLQQRLYAHAFIVADQITGKRVVYVSVDTGGTFNAVRTRVLDQLEAMYPGLYDEGNVMIGITHTHVAPAGASTDKLYEIAAEDKTMHGFSQQVLDITVDGIVKDRKSVV